MLEVAREEWRPVGGYDGRYSVSSLGRVRSEERHVRNNASGAERLVRERIIKHRAVQGGYLCVWLCTPGEKHRVFKVADLVLTAFVGPKPPGLEVLHGAAGKTVNSTANLRYGTKLENAADAKAHGTQAKGERHGHAKLSDADVARIQADPRPSVEIALEEGISYAHVRALKTGRRRA